MAVGACVDVRGTAHWKGLGDRLSAPITIQRRRGAARRLPPLYRSSFRCMHGDELLRLTSHHVAAPPVIEERPSGHLGYFVNKFGEQLVFVHDDADAHATLFHGDVDWEPHRLTDARGGPDAGDLILNDEESAFIIACWIATAWRREDAHAGRSAA